MKFGRGTRWVVPIIIKDVDKTKQRVSVWYKTEEEGDLMVNNVYVFHNLSTDKFPDSEDPPYFLTTTSASRIKLALRCTHDKFTGIGNSDASGQG